ncbi:hypothetical protein [Streptomyces sp. DH24]|uniref:hypothetical protein n=1 Tax=Streptomyces sp. DH24 TaxID=3040123 RepID=UPI002442F333|nr:hypothetical protein [Streptomyces sp. DH24]MDG9717636.1 hypothetical protein [Streptomyces sp. DH24]
MTALRASLLGAQRLFGATFAFSSLATPFFLGTVAGAVASDRVPAGITQDDTVSSWLNPTSLISGALAVGTAARLAAVYLTRDAFTAATAWAVGTATAWRAGGTRPSPDDPAFAVLNSVSPAAVIAHLTGWPRRRTRLGLPWLTDCEGLGPRLVPYYNPILYVSGTAAVAALLLENDSAPRRLPLLTTALFPSSSPPSVRNTAG